MYNKDDLINFEYKIGNLYENGYLPFLMHFCGGNEEYLINLFNNEVKKGDYILSTHRNHYHYLLAGGSTADLEKIIKRGDSMFVFDKKLKFLSSSILSGNTSIAAGISLSLKLKKSKNKVWCFLGDGAEDEGNFYESVCMVDGNNLPCTFIIEDNNRSVETSKKNRKGNNKISWPHCVRRCTFQSTFPHSGTNSKKHINFKR